MRKRLAARLHRTQSAQAVPAPHGAPTIKGPPPAAETQQIAETAVSHL